MATTITLIPARTVSAGTINFGPVSIPSAISSIQISADTVLMVDPAMSWALNSEISLDSGATWQSFITAGRVGQTVPPNDPTTGLPATKAGFAVVLPDEKNGGTRQFRGSFTWAGPSMVMGDMTLTTS